MYKDKKILAVIPARNNSKGLAGKNIKKLCGKPLVAWTIDAALNSAYLDEIVVSTDSEIIANIARKYGANVPFIRPPELATDSATSFSVIDHCIEYFKQQLGIYYDYIVLLEPTSPLREVTDIDDALKVLMSSNAKSIVGVCKTESQNPSFLYSIDLDGILSPCLDDTKSNLRRQDINAVYYLEGTIYISEVDYLIKKMGFYHDKTMGYCVPKWKSFEVDDIVDWCCVEAMLNNKSKILADMNLKEKLIKSVESN